MIKSVLIRNLTRQGIEVVLGSGKSYSHKWLNPGEKFVAPGKSVTSSLLELKKRGLIQIQEVR